jgi:MbtH protein
VFHDISNFQVVVNHEGQYSIWPTGRSRPLGWLPAGFTGSREQCLHHIDVVGTAERPISVRR